jgi:hypothetical protein
MSLFDQVNLSWIEFPLAPLVLLLVSLTVIGLIALIIEGFRNRIARQKDGLNAGAADRDVTGGARARESVNGSLEGAVFELVGLLRGCSYTLRVLSGENQPISFEALRKKVWLKQELHSDMNLLPGSAIRAVLRLLRGPGFVQSDHRGFLVTQLGRALCARVEKRFAEFDCQRSAPATRPFMQTEGRW